MAEIWSTYIWPFLVILAHSAAVLVILLVAIAFLLVADRKIWAAVQLRRGPNVVGPFGLLQSFADMLKFIFKEPVIPAGANKGVFLLAPLVSSVLALSAWAVIPVNEGWAVANLNIGILYVPDFVSNAGGLIQLAGTHLGLTEAQIDQKIADIEQTTARVLQDAESMPSTHAAAVALADQRIAAGPHAAQEQVHAG